MKSKKHFSYLFLALVLIYSSSNLFAGSIFRPIRASISPNFRYSLNGTPILSRTPAILYQGTVYAPINKLGNALGYDVEVRNNRAIITTPTPTPAPTPTPNTVTIPSATIIGIDFGANRITVVPTGKSYDLENQINLLITNNTSIVDAKTKQRYSINDLDTDMNVKIVHSAAMTNSIPPQAQAIEITVLGRPSNIQPR